MRRALRRGSLTGSVLIVVCLGMVTPTAPGQGPGYPAYGVPYAPAAIVPGGVYYAPAPAPAGSYYFFYYNGPVLVVGPAVARQEPAPARVGASSTSVYSSAYSTPVFSTPAFNRTPASSAGGPRRKRPGFLKGNGPTLAPASGVEDYFYKS